MGKGFRMSRNGYRQRLMPDHPRADNSGYVMEHILVFEEKTGVTVPEGCCVHHLNGDKADNRIENLCMMSHGAHTAFHHIGTKRSEQTRAILSEKAKARFADKRNHPFYKDVDVAGMVEMRRAGAAVLDICKHFGITKSTYYKKMGAYKHGT